MFVISLLNDGELIKTSIQVNANAAVDIANEWYAENNEEYTESGFIAIDQQPKRNAKENVRFAEVTFDQEPNDMKMFLATKTENKIFQSSFSSMSKTFFISFLEYSLVKLSEVLREKKHS